MFKTKFAAAAISLALGGLAHGALPITFDPDGPGPAKAVTILTFDWLPSSALAVNGNPKGGLVDNKKVTILTHAKLSSMIDAASNIYLPPAGTEITFVAGFGESVQVNEANGAVDFLPDLTNRINFFEMWVSTPDINNLAGTGFNTGTRIMLGLIADSSGNFAGTGKPPVALDQFVSDNYPGTTTIVGSGSTQISVNVIYADPDYFPTLNTTVIDDNKVFFNTSQVTPYKQVDPSAKFVNAPNGALPSVDAGIGSVNGGLQNGTDLNFELQADANQSLEPGVVVPGACRVTYGGNDRNGNIAPNSFGQACAKVPGGENCYTFGGQVGAPTANPALGGPFGEHTHHNVSGPAGDFVFHAGTHSAPKNTRIDATACKDEGACRQAAANAGFKQIDFEGTGSFRMLDSVAAAWFATHGGGTVVPDNASDRRYYFRVDMDDFGEPGNKPGSNGKLGAAAAAFLAADQNSTLASADPTLASFKLQCNEVADVYQFYICPSETRCEEGAAMYKVSAYLTGGNIQLHKIIK